MAELVIFDCDGVLVHSERLAIKVDVQILTNLGWQITKPKSLIESTYFEQLFCFRRTASNLCLRMGRDA